jgi:hypothetical protein
MSWEMGIPNFYFLAPPLLGGLHYIFFRVASRCIAFASCRPHSSPHKPTRCRPMCLLSSGLRLLAWWVSDIVYLVTDDASRRNFLLLPCIDTSLNQPSGRCSSALQWLTCGLHLSEARMSVTKFQRSQLQRISFSTLHGLIWYCWCFCFMVP